MPYAGAVRESPAYWGRGSNSCLYDGTEITEHISPLGFILGDEGSGAVLGKLLVGDCLKRQLPVPLVQKFMDQYELTPALLLERVYKQPFPNRFLATLSRFLLENITEQPIYNLVYTSFRSFFLRNVALYPGADTYPIHFGRLYRLLLSGGIESCGLILRLEGRYGRTGSHGRIDPVSFYERRKK